MWLHRGIDIDDVTHVMNFDLPYSADTLIYIVLVVLLVQGKKARPFLLLKPMITNCLVKLNVITKELLKARILEGLEPRTKPPKDGEVKSMSKKQKARIKRKA